MSSFVFKHWMRRADYVNLDIVVSFVSQCGWYDTVEGLGNNLHCKDPQLLFTFISLDKVTTDLTRHDEDIHLQLFFPRHYFFLFWVQITVKWSFIMLLGKWIFLFRVIKIVNLTLIEDDKINTNFVKISFISWRR